MTLAIFQLTVTVAGLLFGLWVVRDCWADGKAVRHARTNGVKSLMAQERLIGSLLDVVAQLVLLFAAMYVLMTPGTDFLSPSGALVSAVLMIQSAFRRVMRRRLWDARV